MSANAQNPDAWEDDEGTAESGEGPRARALTLVGVGPASGAVVVGAVAKPASVPPPVPTTPNLFDAIDRPSDGPSDEPDDDAWPETTRAEPAAAAPAPASPAEERPRPRTRSSRLPWVLPAVAVLGASGAVAWRHHVASLHVAPTAASPPPSPPVAPMTDPAPPQPAPEPLATAAVSPASTAPAISVPSFDAEAAESALAETAKTIARCRYGAVYGKGQATVTFGVDGSVTECSVSGRFRWTATGACVKAALSAVHTAPFAGGPETVAHPFEVAPR